MERDEVLLVYINRGVGNMADVPYAGGYAIAGPGPIGRPTNAVRQILLTIVTLGIWAYVWVYRQFEEIKVYSGEGVGGILGLILQIFVGIVVPFLLANEVQTKLYEKDGQVSPVRTTVGFWVFLPLVGSIIWYLKMQKAINEFWTSHGAVAV
jgi:hypothetical protein